MVEGTFTEWDDLNVLLNPCYVVSGLTTSTVAQEPITGIVRAADILVDFDSNSIAATAKYKDQTFSVIGVVDEIDHDYSNNAYVDLGSGSSSLWIEVRCSLSDAAQAGSLAVVLEITVEGTFAEWDDLKVSLNPCSVVGGIVSD